MRKIFFNEEFFENIDCGENHFLGNPLCAGNQLFDDYISYLCEYPGEISANCDTFIGSSLVESCEEVCLQNSCLPEYDVELISVEPNYLDVIQSRSFKINISLANNGPHLMRDLYLSIRTVDSQYYETINLGPYLITSIVKTLNISSLGLSSIVVLADDTNNFVETNERNNKIIIQVFVSNSIHTD